MIRGRRREKWLQVRLDDDEHRKATRLAEDYDMDMSSFIRAALIYFDEHRPVLMFPPVWQTYQPGGAKAGGRNLTRNPSVNVLTLTHPMRIMKPMNGQRPKQRRKSSVP